MLSDAELVARATVFNAGSMPVMNGFIFEDDDENPHGPLTVEYRGKTGWAICSHRCCLSKDGELEYESMPSERTEEYIARTRFPTVYEAFAFLEEWMPRMRREAEASGKCTRWKDYIATGDSHLGRVKHTA